MTQPCFIVAATSVSFPVVYHFVRRVSGKVRGKGKTDPVVNNDDPPGGSQPIHGPVPTHPTKLVDIRTDPTPTAPPPTPPATLGYGPVPAPVIPPAFKLFVAPGDTYEHEQTSLLRADFVGRMVRWDDGSVFTEEEVLTGGKFRLAAIKAVP